MALAAEEYADLADQMGVAGTAAANLTDILDRLSRATQADAAAAKAAQAAGVSVAQLRAAQAAATRDAAAAEQALAAAQRASAAAAKEQAAADKARQADNLARMKERDAIAKEQAEAQKKLAADQLAGKDQASVAKWFGDLQKQSKAGDDALLGFTTQLQSIAQEAAPVVAALAAVTAGIAALGHEAIKATQAKDAMREMLGPDVLDAVERMSERLPFTADQLGAMAKGLVIAGYSGERLNTALQAVAASAAKMHDGGSAAQALLERMQMMADVGDHISLDRRFLMQLAAAGLSVQDLAKQLGVPVEKLKTMQIKAADAGEAIQRALIAKGAGALSVMGSSLDVIKAKVLEGLGDSFDELGDIVHPLMEQVRSFASEIFKGSAGSQILAGIVHDILAPAFEIATRTVRAAHIAFLYLEIAYLRAVIALRPLTSAMERLGITSKLVDATMFALGGFLTVLTVLLGAVAVAAFLATLPFILVAVAIGLVIYGIVQLVGVISGAIEHFDQISAAISNWVDEAIAALGELATGAAQAGADFVEGLVDGIVGGAIDVVQAASNLGASAVNAFKASLGIKSPSRVMREHGKRDVAGGFAMGVDEGAEQVDDAMGGLVTVPKGGAKGRRGGGAGVYIDSLTINFTGTADDFEIFREKFDAYLEELRAGGPDLEATS